MKPDKIKVLCVDDEPHVLQGIALHLGRKTTLFTATSGSEALAVLAREPDIAVVVSDMRMPVLSGSQLLAKVKEVAPDTSRILLTGQADLTSAIAAVNEGGIFRFLMKPCSPTVVLEAVEAGAVQHRLVTSERQLLEQTLRGAVQTLTEILALTHPQAFGRAQRLRRIASELSAQMKLPQAWQVEVAAMVRDLGSITLPAEVVDKLERGVTLDDTERAMAARATGVTEQLLAHIPRLEGVRAILTAAARPPLAVAGQPTDDVQRSAAVLRVADVYDRLHLDGHTAAAAVDALRQHHLDEEVLQALASARGARVDRQETVEIAMTDLEAGMVLVEEVRMTSGSVLVPRGFEVSLGFLERLRNFPKGSIPPSVRVVSLGASERKAEPWHTTK